MLMKHKTFSAVGSFLLMGALNTIITFSATSDIWIWALLFYLQAYHDPMLKLSIMTEQELNQIFGTLDSLIPLHEGKTQIAFSAISLHLVL